MHTFNSIILWLLSFSCLICLERLLFGFCMLNSKESHTYIQKMWAPIRTQMWKYMLLLLLLLPLITFSLASYDAIFCHSLRDLFDLGSRFDFAKIVCGATSSHDSHCGLGSNWFTWFAACAILVSFGKLLTMRKDLTSSNDLLKL